jgi:prepilin peptidase CpaA
VYGQVTVYAFIIAAAFALMVMWWDLKTMTIPNWLTGGAAVVFLGMIFVLLPMDDVIARLIGSGVVLVAGLLMFFAGGMGGGDVKAATAYALLIAPADRGVALLMLAVFGLLGIVIFWVLRRTPIAKGSWAVWSAPKSFPYGIALSATLITYMGLTVLFLR